MKTIKSDTDENRDRFREIEKLLPDTGRKTADMATGFILEHPEFFPDIIEACLAQTYPVSMRASRVVYLCGVEDPEIIRPHLNNIIDSLVDLHDESVIRNFLHIFEDFTQEVDDEHLAKLVNICFNYLEDPARAIAIRAYAVNILLEAGKKIPEINSELIAVLEFLTPDERRTFQKFAKRVIKQVKSSELRVKK